MTPLEIMKKISPRISVISTEHSWKILRADYSAQIFGNAFVEIDAELFLLRIVRDRGQLLFDIRPSADTNWQPIDKVLSSIGIIGVGEKVTEDIFCCAIISDSIEISKQLSRLRE